MSAKQVSLKSPATIVVVVVLLAAVVVLNLRTFGGGSGSSGSWRGHRVQAHPPVPSDVSRLVNREVALAVTEGIPVTEVGTEELDRDPFFERNHKPMIQPKSSSRRKAAASSGKKRSKPLQCSAIMLGGTRPMAIINGESAFLGDQLKGMTLTAIDADGVTFKTTNGSITHLPVGVGKDKDTSFRVVTRTRETGDQGQTHLVDQ